MKKEIYNIEGIKIEIEKYDKEDSDAERRKMAYAFKVIREESGMNRKDFSDWLGIPYRTMQEWELGRRMMPEYVLRLIAYKVYNEKQKKEERYMRSVVKDNAYFGQHVCTQRTIPHACRCNNAW